MQTSSNYTKAPTFYSYVHNILYTFTFPIVHVKHCVLSTMHLPSSSMILHVELARLVLIALAGLTALLTVSTTMNASSLSSSIISSITGIGAASSFTALGRFSSASNVTVTTSEMKSRRSGG